MTHEPWDVIVVGAGAAGLFAATEAATLGKRTLLLEKNRKAGVKILASGGTKCNVTSTLPIRELGGWFGRRAERFLRHGLHLMSPERVRSILAEEGVPTDEYELEKVFPTSFRAADVLEAFMARLERSGATLSTGDPVRGLRNDGDRFVVTTEGDEVHGRRVIVTVGGSSYPKSGTTGDGYGWMARMGHEIVPTRPALVPLHVKEYWVRELTGIAVEDCTVSALDGNGKTTFSRRRPLLFTHRGFSGPAAMDVSSHLGRDGEPWRLAVDWLPEVTREELEARLREAHSRSMPMTSLVPGGFPRRLVVALLARAAIPASRTSSELRKEERRNLVEILKHHVIPIAGDEGWDKAEVTAGGVSLDQVAPKTMESRLVPGLHIAGEILDIDGPIGGFNFQAAFSTATVAGRAAAR